MEKTTQPLTTVYDKPQKLYSSITPARAKKLAQELNKFLQDNQLIYDIAGKKYIPVEGWEFLGSQMGLTQVITACVPVVPDDFDISEKSKEVKYRAEVEIVNQVGTILSRGFAWCSDQEKKKKGFEEYAVASMAQTRAIGKAYRNILSWIVKMGGYEATPYEEIDSDKMEEDLIKSKQKLVKRLDDHGIIKSSDVMDFIEKSIGKRNIDTVNDIQKVNLDIDKLDE